jgi:serine/threonine-protein kinase
MATAVQQIGRYRIQGELGRGAMGIVYRALDPAIGRTVAVKTIRLGDFSDPAERARLRERLFREARSAGALSHPNIVTIYDIAEENDTAYVFMEFVDGQTLEQLLTAPEPLERAQLIDILRQTAAALDYAHHKGIVHRDIKPANIMVSVDGQVKITDFGVARIVSQQMTQAGTILGTPNYMSPEQIQGAPVDGRSDQYSLAVIAYEMLTGEKPHSADSLPTLLFKIAKEEPPPARRLNPTLGNEVDVVLGRALAKDPAERYASCSEFVSALAIAVEASPEWAPLKRGSVASLETVVTSSDSPAPAQIQPAPASAEREASAPVTIALPPRERRRPLEEKESSPVRAALVLLLALAAVGFGIFAFRQYTGGGEMAPADTAGGHAASRETPTQPVPTPAAGAQPAPKPPEAPAAVTEPAPLATGPPKGAPQETARAAKPAVKPAGGSRTPPPAAPSPAEYSVALRSDPPGATIVTDSGASCRTPCSLLLREGRHVLTANANGYRVGSKAIQVPEDLEVSIALQRMTGTLAVLSNPPGAAIFVNGQKRPEVTPAKIELPVGTYKITVALEGRTPSEETVQIRDKGLATLRVEW